MFDKVSSLIGQVPQNIQSGFQSMYQPIQDYIDRPIERSLSKQIIPQLREGVKWLPQSTKEFVRTLGVFDMPGLNLIEGFRPGTIPEPFRPRQITDPYTGRTSELPTGIGLAWRASDPFSTMIGEAISPSSDEGLGTRTLKGIYEGRNLYSALRQKDVHPALAMAAEMATPSLINIAVAGKAIKRFGGLKGISDPDVKDVAKAINLAGQDLGMNLSNNQVMGIAAGFDGIEQDPVTGQYKVKWNEKRMALALGAANFAPMAMGFVQGPKSIGYEKAPGGEQVSEFSKDIPYKVGSDIDARLTGVDVGKMDDVLQHEALYRAYPSIRDINTKFNPESVEGLTRFRPGSDVPTDIEIGTKGMSPEDIRGTVLHEAGVHVPAKIEGYEGGTLPSYKKGIGTEDLATWRSTYRDTPGEQMAYGAEVVKDLPQAQLDKTDVFAKGAYDVSGKIPAPGVEDITKFEAGEMTPNEEVSMIQKMVDDGSVWQLQGSYGRTAMDMIDQGLVTLGPKPTTDYWGNRIPSKFEVEPGTKGSVEYVKKMGGDVAGKVPSPVGGDRVDKIIAYESGEMTEPEMVKFFQELVDDGSAWSLQGHYGRTAQALIDEGLVKPGRTAGKIPQPSKQGAWDTIQREQKLADTMFRASDEAMDGGNEQLSKEYEAIANDHYRTAMELQDYYNKGKTPPAYLTESVRRPSLNIQTTMPDPDDFDTPEAYQDALESYQDYAYDQYKDRFADMQPQKGDVAGKVPAPVRGRGDLVEMTTRFVDDFMGDGKTPSRVKSIKNPEGDIRSRIFRLDQDQFPLGGRADMPYLMQDPTIRGVITDTGDIYYANGNVITHEEMVDNLAKMGEKVNDASGFTVNGRGILSFGDLGSKKADIQTRTKQVDRLVANKAKIEKATGGDLTFLEGQANALKPKAMEALKKSFGLTTDVQGRIPPPKESPKLGNNQEVADAFATYRNGRTKTMMIGRVAERPVVYSYGEHFPIALRTSSGEAYFNTDKYSPTTSNHQRMVKEALDYEGVKLIETDTKGMQKVINDLETRTAGKIPPPKFDTLDEMEKPGGDDYNQWQKDQAEYERQYGGEDTKPTRPTDDQMGVDTQGRIPKPDPFSMKQKWSHGGKMSDQRPMFFTTDEEATRFYSSGKYMGGEDYGVKTGELNIQKPFNMADQNGATKFVNLIRRAGFDVKVNRTPNGGWDIDPKSTAPVRQYSPYDGSNLMDWLYVPEVKNQLLAEGYDGVVGYDPFTNREIPVAVPLTKSSMGEIAGRIPAPERELGVTAYRGEALPRVRQTEPYYQTPRGKWFEKTLDEGGRFPQIQATGVEKAPGIWEGQVEPSYPTRVTADTDIATRAFGAYEGMLGNQDAVAYFKKSPKGDDLRWTVEGVDNIDRAIRQMDSEGLMGGTGGPDNKSLIIYDMGGEMGKQVKSFAKKLGAKAYSDKGKVEFIEAGDYGQTYSKYKARHPEAPSVPDWARNEARFGNIAGRVPPPTSEWVQENPLRWRRTTAMKTPPPTIPGQVPGQMTIPGFQPDSSLLKRAMDFMSVTPNKLVRVKENYAY